MGAAAPWYPGETPYAIAAGWAAACAWAAAAYAAAYCCEYTELGSAAAAASIPFGLFAAGCAGYAGCAAGTAMDVGAAP